MTPPEMPFVRFVDVQKTFDGETFVVKDLNLDVTRGEFLTLLGPSGSGKTTCLMMLAGFEAVTLGRIFLAGSPIDHVPPHRRGIGVVFQSYALFPHMTVAENIAFPLRLRRLSRAEVDSRIERALEMVRLKGLGHRAPTQLSGGQQQRVALARALVFDPPLVLMDEPLGALDKQLRHQMQYEIKRLHETLGVTVIYVTHDQAEALTMSARIAILHEGVIQQVATPEEVYERPRTPFVAQFIGENNTLRGTVRDVASSTGSVRLDHGEVVYATMIGIGAAGERALMSLRPERVQINPADGKLPNVFPGIVRDVTYQGDHLRLHVSICESGEFIVKLPNQFGEGFFRRGDAIRLGWRTEDCRAFPEPDRTREA
jgi:putative spermidine/putrescine transport system ATP-binding protein